MSFVGATSTLALTGTVYLVSTLTGSIRPIPLSLYMCRLENDKPMTGWIPRMTKADADETARKYQRN